MNLRHAVFDWQIGMILAAAVLGWLWTYNRQLATAELMLLLSGVIAYFVMANLSDPLRVRGQTRSILSGFLAFLPAAIALYFLLTNDWSRGLGKVSVLEPVLRGLAAWPLSQASLGLNPNVVGGLIAALLPLQVFALRPARRAPPRRQKKAEWRFGLRLHAQPLPLSLDRRRSRTNGGTRSIGRAVRNRPTGEMPC